MPQAQTPQGSVTNSINHTPPTHPGCKGKFALQLPRPEWPSGTLTRRVREAGADIWKCLNQVSRKDVEHFYGREAQRLGIAWRQLWYSQDEGVGALSLVCMGMGQTKCSPPSVPMSPSLVLAPENPHPTSFFTLVWTPSQMVISCPAYLFPRDRDHGLRDAFGQGWRMVRDGKSICPAGRLQLYALNNLLPSPIKSSSWDSGNTAKLVLFFIFFHAG